jgi:hypothetical protein
VITPFQNTISICSSLSILQDLFSGTVITSSV